MRYSRAQSFVQHNVSLEDQLKKRTKGTNTMQLLKEWAESKGVREGDEAYLEYDERIS